MYFGDYDDTNHALDNGYVLEEDLPDFDMTRDYLTGIYEALYRDGDINKLEHCLEELYEQFEMSFKVKPTHKLKRCDDA